jgi:hypothetical protein
MTTRADRPSRVRPWIAAGGLHRLGANLVTVAVGGIAGYISWLHLFALGMSQPVTLGLTAEQEQTAAMLTPFSIDGMIVAGTLKLRQARIEARPAHWAAYAAVILGVALTMAGNIASAPDETWARVLAAAPPAAFLVSVEVLMGRPLTRNLWDILRDAWARRPRRKTSSAPAIHRATPISDAPGRRDRTGAAASERPGPPAGAAPAGDDKPRPNPVIATLVAQAGILPRPPARRRTNGRKPELASPSSPLATNRRRHDVVYRGEVVRAGEVPEHVRRVALALVAAGKKVSGAILAAQYEQPGGPSVRQCVEHLKPIREQIEAGAAKRESVASG